MGPYIFGVCEVWFGISTWSYSVKNNTCAELFGLEMFIESFNLQRRHGGTFGLVWFDIARDKKLHCENSTCVK